MALPAFVYRPVIVWNKTSMWPELLIDGGLQGFLTPVDPIADLTIKTFDNPYFKNSDSTLTPCRCSCVPALQEMCDLLATWDAGLCP